MSPSEGVSGILIMKSRDWPWGGRGDRGDGQLDLQRHRPQRVKKRENAELRKDKQSSIEASRSDFCKR